jgi:hypothetical protein
MITIPFYTPALILDTTQSRIPKRIYQTWKTREVNEKIAECINETKSNNPTYDYYLFGDKECREYLIQNYPPAYINAFDDLIPGAFKADFWRYAILAKEGGVYIDLDMKPLKSIDYILGDSDFVSIKDRIEHTDSYAIYQAFIGTIPNHPFLIETLDIVLKNIQNHYYGNYNPLGITGPIAMGGAIKRLLNGEELKVGDTNSKRFGKYSIFLYVTAGKNIFPMNGEPVIATDTCIVDTMNVSIFYANRLDGFDSPQDYANLYRDNKVYRSYKGPYGVDICFTYTKNFFVDPNTDSILIYNILFFAILSMILIYSYRIYKKNKFMTSVQNKFY